MAKQLNVSLALTADTGQAKAQLQQLQKDLNSLMTSLSKGHTDLGITKEAHEATIAVAQLKTQLEAATNVNTGKLDLGKFSQSLKDSNMKMKDYRILLESIGPAGEQAFAQLAKSITTAEVPLKRSNRLMNELWTSLKNTARWQLSSSALHGFMGAIQGAYGYAQDLNESLNNIRIVTGQSVDQMSDFAKEANKAAKALSTSTTAYSDAALIYYQQGLSEEEVKSRTDITIKMANVSRQGAEVASEQLTAIWNNFAKGSGDLEHYADVLVRLGADTASSSDEISQGLEKFAATADAIGLSYENAAAALATVTATTRQSADVVGTAFKTIFARIQGLNLGETLDDGTTLNKYSKALESVGINIKDQFGQLKDMDTILAEMGSKWTTLSKDQQVALAQTVAGVRQYNQLVALMDNWDFYEQNLNSAHNADGALQEQANIYAQSWEAASKRVQAASESIYKQLLNDEFFIDLNDGLADFLTGLSEVMDGMGGLKGILLLIGSIATNVFRNQISKGLQDVKYGLQMLTSKGREKVTKTRDDANSELARLGADSTSSSGPLLGDAYKNQATLQTEYLKASEKMSEEQKRISQHLLDQQSILVKNIELASQNVQEAENYLSAIQNANIMSSENTDDASRGELKNKQESYSEAIAQAEKYKSILIKIGNIKIDKITDSQDLQKSKNALKQLASTIDNLSKYSESFGEDAEKAFEDFKDALDDSSVSAKDLQKKIDKLFSSIDEKDLGNLETELIQTFRDAGYSAEEAKQKVLELNQASRELGQTQADLANKSSILSTYTDTVKQKMQELQATITLGDKFIAFASSIGTVVSILNAFQSTIQALNNEDLTFGEKLMAVMSGLSMIIPGVVALLNAENIAIMANSMGWLKNIAAKASNKVSTGILNLAIALETKGISASTVAIIANTAAWLSNPIGWIAAIIMVVVGALIALASAFAIASAKTKANSELLAENAQRSREKADATREEARANEELFKSMQEALALYQDTGEGKENLDSLTKTLAEAYDIEGAALARLTGEYEDYNSVMEEAQRKRLSQIEEQYNEELTANRDAAALLLDTAQHGTDLDGSGNSVSGNDFVLTLDGYGDESKVHDMLADILGIDTTGDLDSNDLSFSVGNNPEELVYLYDRLAEARRLLSEEASKEDGAFTSQYLSSAGIYSDLNQWLDSMSDVVEAYRSSTQTLEDLEIELGKLEGLENATSDLFNVDSYEAYTAWAEQTRKALKELGKTEDEINNIINTLVDSSLNPNASGYQDTNDALSYIAKTKGADLKFLEDIYFGLSEEERSVFLQVDFDKYRTEEAILRQVEYLQGLADQEQINFRTNLLDTASGELNKDGTLSEDTRTELANNYDIDWQEFDGQSTIDQLRTINELAREEISLRQEAFDAEAEWIGQEILSQEDLEQARLDANQAWEDAQAALDSWWESHPDIQDEIDLEASGQANVDEVNALSEAVLNARAEIERLNSIEIVPSIDETVLANLTDLTNRLVSLSDGLKTASSLIEADYIVEADNIEKLATMYPELLRNAKVYEDGRVQLDQAAVQQILGNEVDILNADKDTVRSQLQNQITLLDVQIRFYETKKELLSKALNNEIEYEEAMAGISEAEAQYEVDMNDWATQHGMDNSKISTTLALENLQTIDEKIAEISEHYSRMLSGEVVVAGELLTGSSGSTASQGDKPTGIDNSDYFAELQAELDSTNEQLETLYDTRADLVVLESKLGESVAGAVESMTGALEGTGGNIDDKDSGSKEKEKEIKKLDDEIDRYHEIKELLEDIGVELNRIQKKKDRAWGGGKLAAINEETAALKQQLSALKQYQSQIESNLSKDKGALGQYGWSLDGNGNVSNYEANMARLVNQWNNSAQEDADKEYFENAKKALQQYEESKDLYDDVIDQITDATYALADAELEAIEYSVEIHLELDDNKLKLLEDIMETIGDSAARAVDNIEMIEKSIDTVLHQMETSKDGMKSIFDYIGLSGDVANRIMNGTASEGDQKSLAEILNSYGGAIDMDRVVGDLQQYQDNLLSYNEALRNYRDQVFETVNNAFSEHLEDFDRANDKIAHCVSLVSGYKDLIEAIGRKNIDVHGELTQKLNQALEAQAEDAHRAALAKEKYAQSAYQEALEGYQTAIETGDEYAINKWTEILETAQDELQAAKEDSQAALTEWANAIAESFSSAIQQVIDDLDTALGGLKLLREDFDMAQEIDAQYLDDYEKIYQLSKLTREVQASIDETDNVAAKKALMEYQSKINAYQQQGVQMSQYELDYLRAQYELELARIALEESQNAKSQVSMVKDAEGNYSYVYTADDEAVAEAEQTYEDRLYEMQRLNGDYINELQSNIITMQEEMSAKLEEIANNDLLSYEEKMLRMDEVRSYYLERIHFYDSQLGISIENNKELYDNEWTEYSAKTGYKISANEDYVDSWEETTLAILTNVETQEDYFDQLEQAINHATEEAENCCERAQDALNEAGMTTEELGQTISQTTDELIRDADDAANSAEQMSDEYQRAMQEIMNAATTFTSAYASMISSTIAQNQSLIASMQSVIQMALQMKAALAGASSSGGIGGGSGGGSGGSGGGGNSGQASSLAQSALTLLNEVHHGKYGTNGWIPGAKSAGYDQRVISLVLQALNDSKAGGGYDYFYDKAKQLLGFNTGGYTGNWGTSQGRLALLHQKELVLNAQDTPNILDAVGIVRDIAKAIDINALSAMVNGGLTAATFSNGKEEVLEQNVHITAEFPNATDKHEILEAFDNVINLAAQYANRKN